MKIICLHTIQKRKKAEKDQYRCSVAKRKKKVAETIFFFRNGTAQYAFYAGIGKIPNKKTRRQQRRFNNIYKDAYQNCTIFLYSCGVHAGNGHKLVTPTRLSFL